MKPTGEGKRKILIVGEAPGQSEDEQGKQFIGKAGQWLRKTIHEIGGEMDDCWITNSVICRPQGNKIEDLHIESCRPTLLNTIRDLKPNVVILLGGSAVKSLIGTEWGSALKDVGRWCGWQIPSQLYGAWLCPTFHPSYVLREGENQALVKIVKSHLRQAMALETVPVPRFDIAKEKERIEVILDPEQGRKRLLDLARKEGRLAFDFETDRLKPEHPKSKIVCASFCFEGEDTFSTAIDEKSYPALATILTNKKLRKRGANIKFEERWSIQKMRAHVAGWEFDTMLGAHVCDNRSGITSVKFQSYVRLGVGDYSSAIKGLFQTEDDSGNAANRIHLEPYDVLVYCGLDSLLEYKIADLQMKELGYVNRK